MLCVRLSHFDPSPTSPSLRSLRGEADAGSML
jgi:hypothetical protein